MRLWCRAKRLFNFDPPPIDPIVKDEQERSHKRLREAIHSARNLSMVVEQKARRDKDIADRLVRSTFEALESLRDYREDP